jgi:hypothetical protein
MYVYVYGDVMMCRALLGLRAREVHLCGGSEAMDCVKALLQNTQVLV